MHEAKTNFSKLISLVEAGEEVVVQRGEVPVARIVPYRAPSTARVAGTLKGAITIAEDFDDLPPGFESLVG